jgi:hypothetical protein
MLGFCVVNDVRVAVGRAGWQRSASRVNQRRRPAGLLGAVSRFSTWVRMVSRIVRTVSMSRPATSSSFQSS